MRQVAETAGVSPATVSRVLNGNDYVSADARERVRAAVDRLGGAPQTRASRAVRQRQVFVRCPYILTDYFGLLVTEIVEELAGQGLAAVVDAGLGAMARHPVASLAERTDIVGAILILPPEDAEEIAALAASGLPFVIVDPRERASQRVPAVSAAHAAGGRAVTSHLLDLGHRRIGSISGFQEWLSTVSRDAGHAAALAERGVLPDPALVRRVWPTVEDGLAAAGDLLDLADPPTAIVCFNDNVAAGALHAAGERGLRVPEDLSITGFDDLPFGRMTHPTLTTVHQPLREMGRVAVSLLARLVAGTPVDALHVQLETTLVVRESTAPPRSSPA